MTEYTRPGGHSQTATSQVGGMAELAVMLRKFPAKLRDKVIRAAMKKAGARVQYAAKQAAPVLADPRGFAYGKKGAVFLPGDLKESIRLVVGYSRKTNTITATIKDGVYYGWFIEHGTVYMTARPFMRPALENKTDEVLGLLRDEIAAGVWKAIKP